MKLVVKIFTIIILIILCNTKYLFSDDGYVYYYSGSHSAMLGSNEDISMDYEQVNIKLNEFTYIVDATFEYFNHNVTTTVLVGFPKNMIDTTGFMVKYTGEDKYFAFKTWVNNEPCPFIEMLPRQYLKEVDGATENIRSDSYDGWLVKSVEFKGNSKTTTRVKYIASYGKGGASYIFGTGRSWKGPIGKADFNIKVSSSILIHHYSLSLADSSYAIKRIGENEFNISFVNIEPESDDDRISLVVNKDAQPWEFYGNYGRDPKAYLQDSICHFLGIDNPDGKCFESNFCVMKPKDGKIENNFAILSLSQLRLLKNSVYGIYGKDFKDKVLNDYFSTYFPINQSFKETDIPIALRNATEAIRKYEDDLNSIIEENHRE